MTDQLAIIPSLRSDGFVELSAGSATGAGGRAVQGRVFRKQLLHYGPLHYGAMTIDIDEDFADTLVANFSNNVCDIVQVPKAGAKNEHTDDPDRNIGEVINLFKNEKGVFADIDVRTDDADKMGKTLLGASALMDLDYKDTKTNEYVGPTLLHTAITNRPYVTNLEGFSEIIAASAVVTDTMADSAVVLTPADQERNTPMTYAEWVAQGKSEYNTDVEALKASETQVGGAVKLTNAIQNKLSEHGLIALSAGQEVTTDDLVSAIDTAGQKIVSLSATIDTQRKEAAKAEATSVVEDKIRGGFILPKEKDARIELRLTNPTLFEQLLPDAPVVKLSNEQGDDPIDPTQEQTLQAEVDRISGAANSRA